MLSLYDHRNLDTFPEFVRADSTRINTTVEVMARAVFKGLFERLADYHRSHTTTDDKGLGGVTGLRVKLEESDVARCVTWHGARCMRCGMVYVIGSASYWESNAAGLFASQKPASPEKEEIADYAGAVQAQDQAGAGMRRESSNQVRTPQSHERDCELASYSKPPMTRS